MLVNSGATHAQLFTELLTRVELTVGKDADQG
jgi:hypothetical protein